MGLTAAAALFPAGQRRAYGVDGFELLAARELQRILAGSGGSQYQPNGTYISSGAGTHKGCLRGPSSSDFDLYLMRWSGSAWVTVTQGVSTTASEDVTYVGPAGHYAWRVESRAGLGAYQFRMQRP